MSRDLEKMFRNVRITKKTSPEKLQQSGATRQVLENIRTQLEISKNRDWVIGMPSMSQR